MPDSPQPALESLKSMSHLNKMILYRNDTELT